MARSTIRRDSRGRFAGGGGAKGKGSRAEAMAQAKGSSALKASAGAAYAKAEQRGAVARRNIRAAEEVSTIGVRNSQTRRYRKASPKARAVAAAKHEKAAAVQQQVSKQWRKDLSVARRRGRNVESLALRRRYIKPQ